MKQEHLHLMQIHGPLPSRSSPIYDGRFPGVPSQHDPRHQHIRAPGDTRLWIDDDPVFGQLEVFCPEGADHFLVEPVSNTADYFNLMAPVVADMGVVVLAPGEIPWSTLRFEVESS